MAVRKGGDMDARHVRRARARRRALGLAAVGTAAGVLGVAAVGGAAPAPSQGDEEVTICHKTGPNEPSQGSSTNPYVTQVHKKKQIIKQSDGSPKGHGKHVKDVIPSFTMDQWSFPGMNMPQGQGLLDNDCFALAIEKTGTPEVVPGGKIDYQVKVTNVGFVSIAYSNIVVKDTKADLMEPEPAPTWLVPGDSLVWTGSRNAPNKLWKCGKELSNTATVRLMDPKYGTARRGLRRSNQFEGPSDSSTWITKVVCPLDLSVTKTPAQSTVEPGGTVSYAVQVKNIGPLAVPNPKETIKVEDPGATLTPPAIIPAMLEPGESLDWAATKVAGGVEACGTGVLNTASAYIVPPVLEGPPVPKGLQSQNGNGKPWPYTSWPSAEKPVSGSSAAVTVAGTACPVVTPQGAPTVTAFRPAGPALTVTKTGPARMLAGGRVAYRVTLTNTGSANATDVVLRDQAPGVFSLISKPTGSTVSGRNIDWNLGTLVPGQSVSATVRFTARRTASGRACNVALATATGVDQVRARACTTIVAARRPATPVTG